MMPSLLAAPAFRLALGASLLATCAGCSMFTDSLARSASEIATQNAVKAIREVDLDRQVDVTLIGGRDLNKGAGQAPRPVQACVYVVDSSEWRPPIAIDGIDCVGRERDPAVLAFERRVVAPSQVQQFQMKAPGVRVAWVVVDADFAMRPAAYLPLRLRVEGHGLQRVSAWLDGHVISDGSKPLPVARAPGDAAEGADAWGAASTVSTASISTVVPANPTIAPAVAPVAALPMPIDPASAARAARMQAARSGALRASRVDFPRRVDMTLVGGRRLNTQDGRPAEPVLACTYVVSTSQWRPPAFEPPAPLAGDLVDTVRKPDIGRDAAVLASDCRWVSPNQLLQFSLDLRPSTESERWLVVDADYARRPLTYAPLKLRLEPGATSRMSAWLEAKAVFDGRYPLPVHAATDAPESAMTPAPASVPARAPLVPLPSSPPPGNHTPRPGSAGGPT